MGYTMPGWYDIVSRRGDKPPVRILLSPSFPQAFPSANLTQTSFNDLNQQHDEVGILRSRGVFTKFIDDEIAAGIPSNRIIIAASPKAVPCQYLRALQQSTS